LTASAVTAIWNAPYTREQALEVAEFAAADGAISLDIQRRGGREMRVLQVMKLRGSGFRSGEHAYRISSAGIDVFPRLADHQDGTAFNLSTGRASTGVEALDKMLGDGYWEGSSTLICGPSGVGKTLMGLHFIFQGARTGQPGIHATFQETENQIARVATGFGWSIDEPGVNILSRSLVDMYIDQWVYELLDLIEKTGAKRIVIDSLIDLMVTAGDPLRFREWMYSLVQRCARRGISLMMIVEVPELFQLRRISEEGISHLSDNVVLLQYVQDGSRLVRAVTVLKTRAARHEPIAHRYEISNQGLVLGDEIALER
jgi:circadian clock protein KaiC